MSQNLLKAKDLLKEPFLDKTPDEDQFAVATSSANTIVAAGAGSGKTQTLATRFAWLVMSDPKNTVDKILTLTFTNKAAAEMYRRIYLTLKNFSLKLEDSPERERARAAVENFSKAHIQTLDSFSMEIVKEAANLYGITPDFSVGSADTSSIIEDLAFDFVMEHRKSKSVQWLGEEGDFKDTVRYFCEAADEHTSLADSLTQKCAVFRESLKKQAEYVSSIISKPGYLEEIFDAVHSFSEVLDESNFGQKVTAAVRKLQEYTETWYNESGRFSDIILQKVPDLVTEEEEAVAWAKSAEVQGFCELLKGFDENPKSDTSKYADLIDAWEEIFGSAGSVRIFLDMVSFIGVYEYLKDLYSLLDDFVETVNVNKRRTGSLTFKDSSSLALRILYDQGQIRKEQRDNFTKIMIDEFQDNNSDNRDFLLLISRKNENGEQLFPDGLKDILEITGEIMEDRLFFVGDEKQSIYKFRGADVSVFNGLKSKINGTVLNMSNNYRSDRPLLEEFNKLFGAIGLPEECMPYAVFPTSRTPGLEDFEAVFDMEAAARFPSAKNGSSADAAGRRMHFCVLNKSVPKDAKNMFLNGKESRIYFIGQKILELVSAEKEVEFQDAAVLARSRTDYPEFARIFSLMHIPYEMDQEADIFAEAPVNDIYNLLRLCVYPNDMNCYCAFLCSPICGLDLLQAQTVLALTENSAAFDERFDAAIKADLGNGGFEKYCTARKFFTDSQKEILCKPITETITKLWYECGYRYAPLWTKTNTYSGDSSAGTWRETGNLMEEQYDLLFELGRQADMECRDVSWFVDQLSVIKENRRNSDAEMDAKDADYQTEKKNAVRIMTIHKSKGLEFPYVFVCGCADVNSEREKRVEKKIFDVEGLAPVVLYNSDKDNLFVRTAGLADKKKEEAEFRRLVYVAITRAINHVYIICELTDSTGYGKSMMLDIVKYYLKYSENNGESLFDIGFIPMVTQDEFNTNMNSNPISIEDYNKKISERAALYDSVKAENIITTPELPYLRTSPSSMEEKDIVAGQTYGEDGIASSTYPEINVFVNKKGLQKTEYGTLFHSFMEAWSKDPDGSFLQGYTFDESLVAKLSESHKKILLDTFKKILKTFVAPEDGSENPALEALRSGREYHAEYKFKTKICSYIFKGSIDAVFRNADGSCTVLDYKTDINPEPQVYYNQLGCYQKVAADLFTGGDLNRVRCVLFFAETGKFVDISENARKAFSALTDERIAGLMTAEE